MMARSKGFSPIDSGRRAAVSTLAGLPSHGFEIMTVKQLYKSHFDETGDVSAAAMLTLAELLDKESPGGPESSLLTIQQVAALFQVNMRTIRRRVSDGTFPKPVKIGRSLRWNRADLELDLNHGKHL